MVYYEGEKSVGLMPIVCAVSAVAVIVLGGLYFTFGHNFQAVDTGSQGLNNQLQSTPVQPTGQPTDSTLQTKAHSHV